MKGLPPKDVPMRLPIMELERPEWSMELPPPPVIFSFSCFNFRWEYTTYKLGNWYLIIFLWSCFKLSELIYLETSWRFLKLEGRKTV